MRNQNYHVNVSHRVDDIDAVTYYSALAFLDQRSLVTRLFASYSLCLKALVVLGFFAQFLSSSVYANVPPNLLAIPPQTVIPEQLFSYRIALNTAGKSPSSVRLINAPKGATISDNGDGSYQLRWIPPASVNEQTVIIVQAFDVTQPNLISTQRVVLERASATQKKRELVASVAVASNNAIGSRFLTPSKEAKEAQAAKAVDAEAKAEAKAAAEAADVQNNSTVASSTQPTVVEADAQKNAQTTAIAKLDATVTAVVEAEVEKSASLNKVAVPSGITNSADAPASDATSMASRRPELPELGIQRLIVGEDFQFFIRPITPGNEVVQLSAQSLPQGASFEDVFEGSKMLRWTPTADQVGEHKMALVLVAEDNTDLSLRTEREVIFIVYPEPPVAIEPDLYFEPMSAQIVSAGRKVNIRVEPVVTDDKLAFLHVDRLPAGGSFDENKDGTRTFHWPTTQADQGEHTFRFTAIHPDNAELVASVNVLIVVGSPDGPGTTPNVVATSNASPAPELDPNLPQAASPEPYPSAELAEEPYPSADSPSPSESEPYPTADTASPEPLAVRPPPQPRPTPD